MVHDILRYIGFFLVPGLVFLVFGRRMVEHNARGYPRLYGPFTKRMTLIVCYLIGILWIALGTRDLVLAPLLHW